MTAVAVVQLNQDIGSFVVRLNQVGLFVHVFYLCRITQQASGKFANFLPLEEMITLVSSVMSIASPVTMTALSISITLIILG